MIKDGIKTHTGLGVQVKSVVVDEEKRRPSLLLEAQMDGPPGLLTDEAELQGIVVNSLGQEVGQPSRGYQAPGIRSR